MRVPQPAAMVEQLSAYLLRLGRVAREVPASEFLGHAVGIVREAVDFRSGWWGLVTDHGKSRTPSIHQAEYIALPDDFAAEWRRIAPVDDFGHAIRSHVGEVQRFGGGVADTHASVAEFDRRYALDRGMGLILDDASSGHAFFIVVYRGARDAPFGDDETLLFVHLLRHTIQLWHHSLQDALAAASKEGITQAALARSDGHVFYAGPELCELVYAHWPAWDGIRLPAEIVSRFAAAPCDLRLHGGVIRIAVRGEHFWLVRSAPGAAAAPLLSPRERRVAHLFAAGHSYKEIARQLALTPATVRTYLRDAYLRLGVRNKVQLGSVLGGDTVR